MFLEDEVRWVRRRSLPTKLIISVALFFFVYIIALFLLVAIVGGLPTTWLADKIAGILLFYLAAYTVMRVVWKKNMLGRNK